MTSTFSRIVCLVMLYLVSVSAANACGPILEFSAKKLRSLDTVDFCETFAGKPLLIVNTASKCGFTSQFKELEELHQRYAGHINIVGFPSDDFNQELADSEAISEVCYINYGVTFTMLEPSVVKGVEANRLFKQLAAISGQQPTWNFNKYLIAPNGRDVLHFDSGVKPLSRSITEAIDAALDE